MINNLHDVTAIFYSIIAAIVAVRAAQGIYALIRQPFNRSLAVVLAKINIKKFGWVLVFNAWFTALFIGSCAIDHAYHGTSQGWAGFETTVSGLQAAFLTFQNFSKRYRQWLME